MSMLRVLQVISLVLGAVLAWWRFAGLDGTEFSGGRLTGPLLSLQSGGALLVTSALLVAFTYPRASAVMTLAAIPSCLSLHLYFLVPGLFRTLFPGDYTVPMRSYFEFNGLDFWSAVIFAAMTLVAFALLRRTKAR